MIKVQKLPSADEIRAAQIASDKLSSITGSKNVALNFILDGREVIIPPSAISSLIAILTEFAKGNAVNIAPVAPQLTIREAAGLLNVSAQTVMKLLDSKLLKSAVTDNRKKIAYRDLIEFKQRSQQKRLEALEELSRLDQQSKNGY